MLWCGTLAGGEVGGELTGEGGAAGWVVQRKMMMVATAAIGCCSIESCEMWNRTSSYLPQW